MSTRVLALMLGFTVAAVGSSTRTSPATAGTRRGLVSVQVTRASAQQLTTRGTPRAARAAQLDTEAEVSNAGRFVSRTLTPQFARESNFATFAVQSAGATATATQRANRFGARSAEDVASMRTNLLFEDERRRQQLRQRVVDAELELARSATFYFDIGEARDGLTVQLGRPPAFFELAKALHKMGHSVTPSMLVQREKEGMRAINKLFLDNHRIVNVIVRKYVYSTNLDESDLVQEGNIGLLNAMRLFDPNRSVRFSTFASWHVRGTILRAIMNAHHTIRLPVRVQQEISAIQKEYKQLCIDEEEASHLLPRLERDADAPRRAAGPRSTPSAHERMVTAVAERLGWKREKVVTRLHTYKTAQALSLDAPAAGSGRMHGEGGRAMGDLISCPKSEIGRIHSDMEDVLLRDELRSVLHRSSENGHSRGDRNSVIMRLHYGLEDGVEYTCAQIADMFKMSVSRVYTVIQHELCMLRRLYESGKYGRPRAADDLDDDE